MTRSGGGRALAAAAALCAFAPLHAAGTPAGTNVVNVARIAFDDNGRPRSVESNRAEFLVDEVIDVTVSPLTPRLAVAPEDRARALAFRVVNTGNGPEAFALAGQTVLGGDGFDTAFVRLAFDSNGDGQYDPAVDLAHVAGVNDPELAAGASVTVFVVSDVPGGLTDGADALNALRATAKTGSGRPGTAFARAGANGADAIIGNTTATAQATATLFASLALPELVKTQSVVGPDGQPAAVPGAVITYTLVARHSGPLPATAARITDPIPSGTSYVPGSLTLNGVPLTDASGDDAGQASADGVAVTLATLTAASDASVSFRVRVN